MTYGVRPLRLVLLVVALTTATGVVAAPAPAAKRADLVLSSVKGVPAQAYSGAKLRLKANVRNAGRKRAKKTKVFAELVGPAGATLGSRLAAGKVPALKGKARRRVKVAPRIPFVATGPWSLRICVAPGKQANDCRTTKAIAFRDGSALGRIDAARQAGTLTPGTGLLYKLYAISGDARLPKAYDHGGPMPAGAVFGELASQFASLPDDEKARLIPFLIQPRYAESAWSPAGSGVAARGAAPRRAVDPCAGLTSLAGAWTGIETAHAWFWHRPGNATAAGKAQALATAFEASVWPKLTGAFRAPVSDAVSGCDPAGDAKIDVYVDSGNASLPGNSEGVTPMIPLTVCGPNPAFVLVPASATNWTLAHEFTHAIQFAYAACERAPAWVEGTATWAADFVFSGAQTEHTYKTVMQSPFLGLRDPALGYDAWPFWYSLERSDGAAGIARVYDALESGGLSAALDEGPSDGLYEAWKRFAVERWNDTPIAASGFPVTEAFAAWDGFTAKPLTKPNTDVKLGNAQAATFQLKTFDQRPLSTWFQQVTITDPRVRHLEFTNADAGLPDTSVQAFLRLADGTWKLKDWSTQSEVELCRDKADENVTKIVIATSNAAPDGNPLGATNHSLRADDFCDPPTYQGTFHGATRQFDPSPFASFDYTAHFQGTLTLEPWEGPGATGHEWRLAAGSLSIDSFGGTIGECEIEASPKTFSLPGIGQDQSPVMWLANGRYTLLAPWPSYAPAQTITVTLSGDPEHCEAEDFEHPIEALGQLIAWTPEPIEPDENGHLTLSGLSFSPVPGVEHTDFSYTLIPMDQP